MELGAQQLELDGELFFFQAVLGFLFDIPIFDEADGDGDPADAEQGVDGAGKIIRFPQPAATGIMDIIHVGKPHIKKGDREDDEQAGKRLQQLSFQYIPWEQKII